MTTFEEKEKETFKSKIKEIAESNNLILENTNSNFIWKFLLKEKIINNENENQNDSKNN